MTHHVLTYELRVSIDPTAPNQHRFRAEWNSADVPACWEIARNLVVNAGSIAGGNPVDRIKLYNMTGDGDRTTRHEVPIPSRSIQTIALQAHGFCSMITTEMDYGDAKGHLRSYRRCIESIVLIINQEIDFYEAGTGSSYDDIQAIINRPRRETD